MKPGEIITLEGFITLNEGRESISIMVSNSGDRPIQVAVSYTHLTLPTILLV